MKNTNIKQVSTTALSKQFNISSKEMFLQLLQLGLIEKKGDIWSLTNLGLDKGGKFVEHKQYGKYISWPENIDLNITANESLITSTAIGKKYNLSANKVNFLLSEIGWVYKGLKGWLTTPQGVRQGGVQDEDKKSGIPYVRWPESILENTILTNRKRQKNRQRRSIETRNPGILIMYRTT